MDSENDSSADNQQERLRIEGWLVGFTDGEGAFTVSILKNPTSKTGWQVFPEFIITQGARSKDVLYLFKDFFGCGSVYLNRRHDNHHEDLYRYCVRSIRDLQNVIIPFFTQTSLRSDKKKDFALFCEVMDKIKNKEHLDVSGLYKIANLAMKMNRKIRPKFLESPHTIRQASGNPEEEIVASAWRHAGIDSKGKNDPKLAEM
jgi:hypothetical protein